MDSDTKTVTEYMYWWEDDPTMPIPAGRQFPAGMSGAPGIFWVSFWPLLGLFWASFVM